MRNFYLLLSALSMAIAIGLTSRPAQAGVLIEPYVGYYTGKAKWSSSSSDVSGLGYGLRLAYTFLGAFVGAEYMGGQLDYKDSTIDNNSVGHLGVTVGYEFPVLFRGYLSYFPAADGDLKGSGGGNLGLKGDATKIGVGFTGLPLIAIQVEYMTVTYNKFSPAQSFSTFKEDIYGLNLSVPFSL